MYEASKKGHAYCVETLLARGADPYTENCDGVLPIHVAVLYGHQRLVTHLRLSFHSKISKSIIVFYLNSVEKRWSNNKVNFELKQIDEFVVIFWV